MCLRLPRDLRRKQRDHLVRTLGALHALHQRFAVLLIRQHAAAHRAELLPRGIDLGKRLPVALPQALLDLLIDLRIEQPAQQHTALVALRQQNALELALGDHHHLGVLLRRQAEDVPDCLVHLAHGAPAAPVLACKLRLGCVQAFAAAVPLGHHVCRAPPRGVDLTLVLELQLHTGLRAAGRKVAVKALRLAGAPGGLAVERKADGVKDGGLASAGISRHQKQAARPELGKIHRLRARIGAEGAHLQLNWTHSGAPPLPR